MDKFIFSASILNLIGGTYPGGTEQFTKDGGSIFPIHVMHQCIIYHPKPPKELIDLAERKDITVEKEPVILHISSILNFKGIPFEQTESECMEASREICERLEIPTVIISINPVLTGVVIPDYKFIDDETIGEVIDILLRNLTNLNRGIIITDDRYLPFETNTEETTDNIPEISMKDIEDKPTVNTEITDQSKRDKVIGHDDITNLVIDLGTIESVDDFIARM